MNRDAQGHRIIRMRTLLISACLLLLATVALGYFLIITRSDFVRIQALGARELNAQKYGWELEFRVDQIEISEVESGTNATDNVTIRIGKVAEKHACGPKRNLAGVEAKAFMERWSAMHFHSDYAYMCHEPAFVVRFLNHGQPELETTLCFECSNFPVASWLGNSWMGFNLRNAAGLAFEEHFRKQFPKSTKWADLEVKRLQRQKSLAGNPSAANNASNSPHWKKAEPKPAPSSKPKE